MRKLLVIEDEEIIRNHLVRIIENAYPDVFSIRESDSVRGSVTCLLDGYSPDLIFMDIELSDGLCFEIFNRVNISCPIIYTTAYSKYAIDAFKTTGIEYLLKPVKNEEVVNAIKKFLESNNFYSHDRGADAPTYVKDVFTHNEKKRLLVKLGNKYTPIKIENIAYFYRDEITLARDFKGNNYPINDSLTNIEGFICSDLFFRVNRKIIINVNAIDFLAHYKPGRLMVKLKPKFDENNLVVLSQERSSSIKEFLMR